MSKSRAAGTRWETAVCDYLRTHGFAWAERRALRGTDDRGDVAGVPGVVISCKAERRITLAEYLDEVEHQRVRAGASTAIVVVKRRNKGVADAYLVQRFGQWCDEHGDQ